MPSIFLTQPLILILMPFGSRRRSPLSIVELWTHRALVLILGSVAVTLFVSYLFLLNHLSMQGYVLSKIMKENSVLLSDMDLLEGQLAKTQSREYIQKSGPGKTLVSQGVSKTYVIVPNTVTAQR